VLQGDNMSHYHRHQPNAPRDYHSTAVKLSPRDRVMKSTPLNLQMIRKHTNQNKKSNNEARILLSDRRFNDKMGPGSAKANLPPSLNITTRKKVQQKGLSKQFARVPNNDPAQQCYSLVTDGKTPNNH